jgi:succinate dehydrogenase / fumarate reductase iron-sulfur subunit
MSFLDMLDLVNEEITSAGGDPIAFEHDCREGICGSCGVMVNGVPHGPLDLTTVCQLHLREFSDGDEIWVEPWRARSFPIIKDLVVERASFDRIIQAVPKPDADRAFEAAACIGCGACVAACPNASAMLFTAAKAAHLSYLPQGQPERLLRAARMVGAHDEEGFGSCTNHGACQEACPKGISVAYITRLNRDFLRAMLAGVETGAAIERG